MPLSSVIRCIQYIFQYLAIYNDGHLPNIIIGASMFKILPSTKLTSKNCPNTINFLPKLRNFTQSGHIAREIPRHWECMHVIMLLLDDIERDREERERKRAHSLSHLIWMLALLYVETVYYGSVVTLCELRKEDVVFNVAGFFFVRCRKPAK